MTDQSHPEDPVAQAGTKITSYVSVAAVAAEAMAQIAANRARDRALTDERAAAALRAERAAAHGRARAAWGLVLDPRQRDRGSVLATGQAWAQAQPWRPDPQAERASALAEERLRTLRPDVMDRYNRMRGDGWTRWTRCAGSPRTSTSRRRAPVTRARTGPRCSSGTPPAGPGTPNAPCTGAGPPWSTTPAPSGRMNASTRSPRPRRTCTAAPVSTPGPTPRPAPPPSPSSGGPPRWSPARATRSRSRRPPGRGPGRRHRPAGGQHHRPAPRCRAQRGPLRGTAMPDRTPGTNQHVEQRPRPPQGRAQAVEDPRRRSGPAVDVTAVLAAMQDQLDDLAATVQAQQRSIDELVAAQRAKRAGRPPGNGPGRGGS